MRKGRIRISLLSLPFAHRAGSVGRQILHLALPARDPLRLDQLITVLVQKLVRRADRTVRHAGHHANLARALRLAEQMARHVDARGSDGQGRAAGEIANRADLLREALRHLDVLLPVESELRAEAQDEVYGVR